MIGGVNYLLILLINNIDIFSFGPRFFQLNHAYDRHWRQLALEVAQALGVGRLVKEGVYTMLGGPNFETPTELKMLKMCGVDAVGK